MLVFYNFVNFYTPIIKRNSVSFNINKKLSKPKELKLYIQYKMKEEEILFHLSKVGGSTNISSVIGGWRGSGAHSSQRSSISCKTKQDFN